MPYLIAEIAQAHDGSIGIAHSYIDALANTGVHAVKFQVHIAAAESSVHEPFRVAFSKQDASRYDYWKRMEFSLSQWKELKQHTEEKGMEFLATPFSVAAVELLASLQVSRFKIGSGDINNLLLLELIAQTQKPILLSSGMSSWQEIDTAVSFLQERNADVSLLQCTTAYPTPAALWGLSYIQEMKNRYQIPVGYSDHSGTPAACIAAVALGADLLEFHAVFDKRMFGPDANSSLTIDEIAWLAKSAQQVKEGLQTSTLKEDASSFEEVKKMFGRSLAINKTLEKGSLLSINDLETKKPAGMGVAANQYQNIVGKKLLQNKYAGDFLQLDDVDHSS